MKSNSTKAWNAKAVLIILSVEMTLMICIPMTSAEPHRTLTIDVIDPQTANVEIGMSLPVNDSTAYEYMVNLFHSEYEEEFKEGLKILFDSKIVEYTVVEDTSTFSLRFDLTLNGNYSKDFILREMPVKYISYLPLDYDEITILKNSSMITTITNYVLSTEYKTPLTELFILPSQIAPQKTVTLPIKNAEDISGLNSYSKFCIPDYWVGWGDDPVPGTGYTASQVAEMYKPYYVKKSSSIDYPDDVYYRVYKGDDPYTNTTNDAILIMYYGFWCRQEVFPVSHCNDAEQIYIWANTIGEDPYKIAYDRWTFWDWHLHHVERVRSGNGATWINISNGDYNHDEMEDVYTQHASYYPQGRRLYNNYVRVLDYPCEVLLNDIINPFDNCHLWVRIGNEYHTYDYLISDNDGTNHTTYALSPLDDTTLREWYTTYACCTDLSVCKFAADVSDPFHGLFWEDPHVCDPIFPLLSATIDSSAAVNNGVLRVNVSVLYDNTVAGGSSGNNLRGLWEHRFNTTIDGKSIANPYSLNEYEGGHYALEFDVSGISHGTYTLALNVTDNLDYNFNVDYETIIIQNQPPIANFTYSPSHPVVNQTITFNASNSTDPDGNITKSEWDFGDGSNTTGIIVTHLYSANVTYTVNLTVTDDEGATNSATKEIAVSDVPKVIYVPDNFTKIQWAVDNSREGGTIIVRDGTYIENVDVNTPYLMIQSENGSDSTIVQAANSSDHVFEVTADYVNIIGFTVTGATGTWKKGIYLYNANNCNIITNNVSSNFCGIHLKNSSNNILKNNTELENMCFGIGLSDSSNNKLENNKVSLSSYCSGAICFWSSDNNTLINNLVENNFFCGIDLSEYSNNNILINNSILDNGGGISIYSSFNNTLKNNTIISEKEHGYERYNFDVDGGSVYDNYIQNVDTSNTINGKPIYYWIHKRDKQIPRDAGYIGVVNSTNISVEDIVITGNGQGVLFVGVKNSGIENVTVSNNFAGILLLYSDNCILTNNNASNNYISGIKLAYSNNNRLTNNDALNNGIGFDFSAYCSNNTLESNNASNNTMYGGFFLNCGSNNNTLTYNNALNNSHGIYIYSSSNSNKIFLNNFINNVDNVYSEYSTNIWNSTSKIIYIYKGITYTNYTGNYWDDYDFTGNDTNGDGIGDEPYNINLDNDSYPLIHPFNEYFQKPLVTELNVNPEVADPGDVITISGKASPNAVVWLSSSFEISLPVSDGRYSREFNDFYFPQGEKAFSVIAGNVKDMRISAAQRFGEKVEYPFSGPENATNGIANISISFPISISGWEIDIYGKKNITIYGDAADNATSVNLKVTASKKVSADSNSDFSLGINTESVPEGEFLITAGEIGKKVYIGVTPTPSPCFIATAAYGTPLHEDIDVLRDFRDEYLMTNPVGKTFVKAYYTTSPPIADAIGENEELRTAVRDGLVKPLVYISRLIVR